MITTEIGQTVCGNLDMDNSHMSCYLTWADKQKIGYLAWAWWVTDEVNCANRWDLISNLDGTPKAPVGTWYRAHLIELTRQPGKPGPAPPDPGKGNPASPGPSSTGKRHHAKLRITRLVIRPHRVVFKVRTNSFATGQARAWVAIRKNRDKTVRHVSRRRLNGGIAGFGFKLRNRESVTRIGAFFRGDQNLRPQRVSRPVKVGKR